MGAELHVLRVIPKWADWRAGGSQSPSIHNATELQRFVAACRTTQQWCSEALARGLPEDGWEVRSGVFVQEVAKRAAELDATWLAVAPQWNRTGRMVTTLARVTALPVLLARGSTDGSTIVAATDLGDARYPVLFEAAEVGRRLGSPMVALHNFAPRSLRGVALARARLEVSELALLSRRRQQLSEATRQLAPEAELVIANEHHAVDAILQQARTRNADLIVVGTRSHSWLSRTIAGSVSSELIDRAIRSVLVMPLIDRD
jgi:nucleotide-binding universal stress UspA family protein